MSFSIRSVTADAEEIEAKVVQELEGRQDRIAQKVTAFLEDLAKEIGGYLAISGAGHINASPGQSGDYVTVTVNSLPKPGDPTVIDAPPALAPAGTTVVGLEDAAARATVTAVTPAPVEADPTVGEPTSDASVPDVVPILSDGELSSVPDTSEPVQTTDEFISSALSDASAIETPVESAPVEEPVVAEHPAPEEVAAVPDVAQIAEPVISAAGGAEGVPLGALEPEPEVAETPPPAPVAEVAPADPVPSDPTQETPSI
jgi:hypothetical protein